MRLFVGLDLPEAVGDDLLDLQSGPHGARWVPFDNFHLTLVFVGEVDRHGCEELDAALSHVDAPAFDMTLSGAGFYGDDRPHALWAGVAPSPALVHLQAKVEHAARRAGLKPDSRRFHPHVKLAYLKAVGPDAAAAWSAAHGLFSSGPFRVDAFHLFESRLGSEGAVYESLARYPLSFSM